jgi:hypothetical protein
VTAAEKKAVHAAIRELAAMHVACTFSMRVVHDPLIVMVPASANRKRVMTLLRQLGLDSWKIQEIPDVAPNELQ